MILFSFKEKLSAQKDDYGNGVLDEIKLKKHCGKI